MLTPLVIKTPLEESESADNCYVYSVPTTTPGRLQHYTGIAPTNVNIAIEPIIGLTMLYAHVWSSKPSTHKHSQTECSIPYMSMICVVLCSGQSAVNKLAQFQCVTTHIETFQVNSVTKNYINQLIYREDKESVLKVPSMVPGRECICSTSRTRISVH